MNIRDHSGKKPMQYLVRQDTSVSMDTFKSEYHPLSPDPSSMPGTRIRRHFSTASSNYPPNIRRRSSGSIPLEFVSLPTCNSNAASSPNMPLSPAAGLSRRPSAAYSLAPNKNVHLLSISPIASTPKQQRSSFMSKGNVFSYHPDHKRTASYDDLDKSSKGRIAGSNPKMQVGSFLNKPNSLGGATARRSLRQGFNYFMNNAVPKKTKNPTGSSATLSGESRQ